MNVKKFSVVGALQNSQVEVRKHTTSTLRMFNLSTLKVLERDEPNEIQIKINKSEQHVVSKKIYYSTNLNTFIFQLE